MEEEKRTLPPTPLEKKRKKRVGQFGPPTRPINPALQSLKIPSNLALGKGGGVYYKLKCAKINFLLKIFSIAIILPKLKKNCQIFICGSSRF
jgi:hypothetical protein